MAIVFDSWSGDVGSDRKLQILGSALFRLTEIKPSQIFAVWKKFTYQSKKSKESEVLDNLMEEIEKLKVLLRETNIRCMKRNAEVTALKKINLNIEKKLKEAKDLLNMPARQPPTLHKIVSGFSRAISAFKQFQDPFIDDCLKESLEVGPHTTKLQPIYKWTHNLDSNKPQETYLPHPEFEKPNDHDDYDYANEKTIDWWKPGR